MVTYSLYCEICSSLIRFFLLSQGRAGAQGPLGPRGLKGDKGPIGPKGQRGNDGRDGAPGRPGLSLYNYTKEDKLFIPPTFARMYFRNYSTSTIHKIFFQDGFTLVCIEESYDTFEKTLLNYFMLSQELCYPG